ncbi:MAG: hypothetical protein A2Z91_00470 [Deltaproteobacteria bacterium GWA2_38_16]|nr:MAG: hypothetical protein A2Z91_00470 [Deltaproteobacteria bacterium GWA2_38_16]OGQ03576.1 MAG: hypothetical protein A3D19_01875 [Deltaproteobacteria bacterium RIFCSPHIGHO2_02_FULL_38_15]OGQ30156.1 MAG: hypothetical protein A3A72_01500 [Deltaproteobacteria bacterium RIFCSPLOWO2_01_FULL_38_9]OGQ64031.1 MAG: hypothetical protein A3G92_01135 [Deltaproteobacteria bacterium RIFCSPLOWO2_12_FULL_38_8]
MRSILRIVLIYLGIFFLVASKLFASSADMFGLSSRLSATAGLPTFSNPDPALIYQNPAFLTQAQKLYTTVGILNTADFFKPIENVVVQNELSGLSVETGNPKTDAENMMGMNLGLLLPVRTDFPKIGAGVIGFIPFGSLASVNTGENYVPSYALYYNRPKHFSFIGGVGIKPWDELSMGVGANLYLTSGANTKMNINGTNSSVALAMDIKPAVSFIVGSQYRWDEWSVDASYHQDLNYAMVLKNETKLFDLPIVEFLAKTAMFYDPQMVGVGISRIFKNGVQLGTRLDWKNWKKYQIALNQVTFSNPADTDSSNPVPSFLPEVQFKNIFSPSLGIEFPLKSTWIRAGYRYEPEHIKSQEENSNFLDTDVHILSCGMGRSFGIFTVDLHLQYHQLVSQVVQKTDSAAVGYKEGGYIVGGSLLNYGLTLGTTF